MDSIIPWAAGFFDGEGSVMLSRSVGPARTIYGLKAKAVQIDPRPLRKLQDKWGGKVWKSKSRNPNWRPVWTWEVRGLDAVVFLKDVLPYLQVKEKQAAAAIDYPFHGIGNGCLPKTVVEKREQLYALLRHLNKRGEAALQ